MLCQKCKKKIATVFITKIMNDQKIEQMFCSDCAKNEQIFVENLPGSSVTIDSLLKGFFGLNEQNSANSNNENVMCPVCQMNLSKLAEKGRFGCSECYKVFGASALNTIKRIHKNKRHIGKIPKRVGGALGLKRKLADLRTKLESHVIKEEYEEAAKIRDEIRTIEKQQVAPLEVENDSK